LVNFCKRTSAALIYPDHSRTPMSCKNRWCTHTYTGSGIIVYRSSLKSQILRLKTSYMVDFGSESRFYVSEQVGVLFLVEMCEPDGSEASNTFSMGRS